MLTLAGGYIILVLSLELSVMLAEKIVSFQDLYALADNMNLYDIGAWARTAKPGNLHFHSYHGSKHSREVKEEVNASIRAD